MGHIQKRISNFIKYRKGINYVTIGDLMLPNVDLKYYKQGRWVVDCTLDIFSVPMITQFIQQHELEKNCVFLTSCPEIASNYQKLNFRYFPYFIAEGIAQIKKPDELENPPITFGPRKNIISCVNRFARFNRIYALYKIRQQPNLFNCKISFTRMHPKLPDQHGYVSNADLTLEEMLNINSTSRGSGNDKYQTAEFVHWLKDEFSRLPYQIEEEDNFDLKYDNVIKCQAFLESYANIVTETYVLDYLPTEKVVKPLLAGCLIFPVASINFMKKLELMGFDLKFEGIDYKTYDNIPDWVDRTDAVISLANKLHPNLINIWHANKARLEHNRNLFFTKQLEEYVLQDVHDIFDLNY